jgi:hypothetical protein
MLRARVIITIGVNLSESACSNSMTFPWFCSGAVWGAVVEREAAHREEAHSMQVPLASLLLHYP